MAGSLGAGPHLPPTRASTDNDLVPDNTHGSLASRRLSGLVLTMTTKEACGAGSLTALFYSRENKDHEREATPPGLMGSQCLSRRTVALSSHLPHPPCELTGGAGPRPSQLFLRYLLPLPISLTCIIHGFREGWTWRDFTDSQKTLELQSLGHCFFPRWALLAVWCRDSF